MATAAVGVAAIAGAGYSLWPFLHYSLGVGRKHIDKNNGNCFKVPELKGCEDIWMEYDTGLIYTACSSPASKASWFPA